MKEAAFQPTGRTENEDTMKIGFVLPLDLAISRLKCKLT